MSSPIFHLRVIRNVAPGALHIDRIVRDCLARRLPAEQTAIRLIAASDLAAVLDGEAGA